MAPKKTPLCAAPAVAKALEERRQHEEEETRINAKGRRGSQQAVTLADDVVARLAEQASEQQRVLMSRLIGYGPPTTVRAAPTNRPLAKLDPRDDAHVEPPIREPQATSLRQSRHRKTIHAFDQTDGCAVEYAKDDPMLRYLIHVIAHSENVVRADIPRRPEGVDAIRRMATPEEDVLFLVYHATPPCGFRNVYWLEFITEHRAADGEVEYFTLSHHGLTHFLGSSVVDFVDIESWILEKRAFDYMTAMRGLQKLQGLLFFMSWKKKAVRLKHRRVRARLACSLFHCDATAAKLMIGIREHCVKIESCVDVQQLASATTFTITNIEQQNRKRIKDMRARVHDEANRICELIEREIMAVTLQRQVETEAEKQNYANVSRSSRLLERLYVFLRLADFQLFESISAHMNQFVSSIHAQVCGHASRAEIGSPHRSNSTARCESTTSSSSALSVKLHTIETSAADTRVEYHPLFSLRHREYPSPFVYAQLLENVQPEDFSTRTDMGISPAKSEVFDVVYSFLNGYISCLDSIPRVLSDQRFHSVMAPYTPQHRDAFLSSLLLPSTQILQNQMKKLKEMKNAIDTYFKQLEILVSDRLRLVGDVFAAEENERNLKNATEFIEGASIGVLSAEQYESVRYEWETLLHEIRGTFPVAQVGILLLDQTPLLTKLEAFITEHMRETLEELPDVYRQFLCDLLADVDGRIDRVTRIPTSICDAQQWLNDMMEMMPSHRFRKAFDLRCTNLSRLKQLLKVHGVSCRTNEDQDLVKKKEFEWESIHETLLTCLARVTERDSEHRRSVMELSAKADEFATARIDQVKTQFSKLPSHEEELLLDKRRAKDLAKTKQDMIAQLEQLVSLDVEREDMLETYAAFEHDHRLLTDPNAFETQDPVRTQHRWEAKISCSQLLQHVSIVIDMRTWFISWKQLEDKWLDAPLVTLHGSMVLSRLKQFRRRLQFASTRLLPTTSLDPADVFLARDHYLVQDLEARVNQMASDYVILNAVTCGAFSSNRWATNRAALGLANVEFSSVTLRMIKSRCEVEPASVMKFKELCDVVLVEATMHKSVERLRQRLSRCQVTATSSDFRVVLVSMQDLVLELDDMQMEAGMLVQAQNPGLDVAVSLLHAIQTSLQLCDHLLSFQRVWDELCLLIRVHDMDEFFTGQVAWKGPVQRQKKKGGRDESTWASYVEVAQEWSDRLRRLVCMGQSEQASNAPPHDGMKRPGDVLLPPLSDVSCALHDVMEAFEGFDFESGAAKCERAHQLVDKYVATLREKCPRLYLLSKSDLLQLLIFDDDAATIRRALSKCYPAVDLFTIVHGRKHEGELLQANGLGFSKAAATDSGSSVVIKGIQCGAVHRDFNVPVVKVGRLRFWLTRLDEEMNSVVLENTKEAVATCLTLTLPGRDSIDGKVYEALYPQSIVAALCLRFTSAVQAGLEWTDTAEETAPAGVSDLSIASSQVTCEQTRLFHEIVNFASSAGSQRNDRRLDSMILQLQYQTEVATSMHSAILANSVEDARLMWEAQSKIDFVVEDTSAKTARRVHQCDDKVWLDVVALGPSYPITFVGSIGQSEFSIGRELVEARRIPVITPLTQRCFFEIFQAVRHGPLSLIAPLNDEQQSDHSSIIHGIAQMLMKPLHQISCSASSPLDMAVATNLLKAVVAMGSLLSVYHLEVCETHVVHDFVEKIKQLRQDVRCGLVPIASSGSEHRFSLLPAPTACIFAPLGSIRSPESNAARQLLLRSSSEAFHSVTVVVPTTSHITKTMSLLAGYKVEEIPNLQSVVTFFETVAHLCSEHPQLGRASVHRLIVNVMQDISRLRYSHRILLPSNAKLSLKLPRATRRSGKRISTLFRRSADAQDTSDIVVHTLFSHVLRGTYRPLLNRMCDSSEAGKTDRLEELLRECFPSAKGCELVEKTARTKDEALWETLEMFFNHTGLIPHAAMIEKAMELSSVLQANTSVIVVGESGVGKSTCIKTLHNALQALEMTADHDDNEQDDAADESHHFQAEEPTEPTRLLFVSPRLLANHQGSLDHRSERILAPILETTTSKSKTARHWLCVDGELQSALVETLVPDQRDFEGSSSLELDETHPRIIFESTSLASVSPAILVAVRVIYVPSILTQDDLLARWRADWTKKLPFAEDSRGAANVKLVFRLTEHLIQGPIRQFVRAEECVASALPVRSSNVEDAVGIPSHFGILSVHQLTLACLNLIAGASFRHRALLEERSAAQVARIVVFCVIWGSAGHLSELYRQKLDQLIRQETKLFSELKQACEMPGDLFDSESLGPTFWESIHLPLRGVIPVELCVKDQSKLHTQRVVRDPHATNNRILVVPQAATPLVRILRLLIQSNRAFMVIGPRGSGKSSLLRMLWLMNLEDQAAEVMVDASLDHRFAPDTLNWQYKPRTWFEPPESLVSDTTQHRGRARDEALLYSASSAGAAKFVFIDDLALCDPNSSQPTVDAVDEFVRVVLDHGVAINWTTQTVMPVEKAFGATMLHRELAIPRQRVSTQVGRLLRHFVILHAPTHDRQQLQSMFRHVFSDHFAIASASPNRTQPTSERILPLPEIVVRACVDLAADVLTVQQTSDRLELVDGFSFNLHHLNAELSRILSCCRMVAPTAHNNRGGSDSGANLLSLGKLHQCWISVVRQNFLLACSIRAPPPTVVAEDPSLAVVAIDEIKKIVQAMEMTSEKHFSVPARNDPNKALVTDIVYGTYRYLMDCPHTSSSDRVALEELLTSNASASSSSGVRRKQSTLGTADASQQNTSGGGGSIMARDEYVVDVARDMMLKRASQFLSHSQETQPTFAFDAATCLTLQLHLSSTVGLHQLLHVLQAIVQSANVLVDDSIAPLQKQIFRLAFAMEGFDVVKPSNVKPIQQQIEGALEAAGTGQRRIALWIRLGEEEDDPNHAQYVTELLVATSLGKLPPAFSDCRRLRELVALSCVENQQTLHLLSDEDVFAHFETNVRQNLRLIVVVDNHNKRTSSSRSWLLELMRASASFQWLLLASESDPLRYQREIARRVIHEIGGSKATSVFSREVIAEDCAVATTQLSPSVLFQTACDELFATDLWYEDAFLSFATNVVADFQRRREQVETRLREREALVRVLQEINLRIPQLRSESRSFTTRSEQLCAWQDELASPLDDLETQYQESQANWRYHEDELASDELRSLQRKSRKLETQVWAHRAMINEYDLARHEIARRQIDVDAELRHWQKYAAARESMENRYTRQLGRLQSAQDPAWLMQHSLCNVGRMFQKTVPPVETNEELGSRRHPADDEEELQTRRLWRTRFPFLASSTDAVRGDDVLWAMDCVHDRIPLVVDKSGLFQHVFVQLFSNVPLFADASDEHERRDHVGFSASGAVAPVVVQCDDSDKMWRKLREAQQKQAPVLLVGVAAHQIPSLAAFAQCHAEGRQPGVLARLTSELYRSQLKRDEVQQLKTGGLSQPSSVVVSVAGASAVNGKRMKKNANPLSSLLPTELTSSRQSPIRREESPTSHASSSIDPSTTAAATTRRASLMLADAAKQSGASAPRGLGFQMYAVTQHAIDADTIHNHGGFLVYEATWSTASLEEFFLEGWIRGHDKKLHKDLVDSRLAEVNGFHFIKEAEDAVWPIALSSAWRTPSGREPFMDQLETLHHECERHVSQQPRRQARASVLESRRREFSSLTRPIAMLAQCVTTFAGIVMPESGMYVHSYRYYEQLMDGVATTTAFVKEEPHDQSFSISAAPEASSLAGTTPSHLLLQTVLAGLASSSHRLVLLMTLALQERAAPLSLSKQTAHEMLTWLLSGGVAHWSRPSSQSKKTKRQRTARSNEADSEAVQAAESTSGTSTASKDKTTAVAGAFSGASLVERLRRKVRVCALLFDQMGSANDATPSSTKKTRVGPQDLSGGGGGGGGGGVKTAVAVATESAITHQQAVRLDDMEKLFRTIARSVKTLWCEWKLAKEDQRSDARHAIGSMASTLLAHRTGISRTNIMMRTKHHSVRDMALASTSVTHLVTLSDVVAQHIGVADLSSSASDTVDSQPSTEVTTLGERLAAVMLAKVYFPQLLASEWMACVSSQCDLAMQALSSRTAYSTSRLLGINEQLPCEPDPASGSGAGSSSDQSMNQLPPLIDVAWRRDDLVHLPSRVLLYESSTERVTLDVLLLRATRPSSGPPGKVPPPPAPPLRVFSIVAFDAYESRLREQVVASVTSKERFAIEISSASHLDRVLALVSQVINQHALLCIPEWYVVCDLELFARVQSPSMGFLRVHVVTQHAECVDLPRQLTQWLIQSASLIEADACVAARALLAQATRDEREGKRRALLPAVEALVAQWKGTTSHAADGGASSSSSSRQRRLKQAVLKQFASDVEELQAQERSHATDAMVTRTTESLQFISELLLLPSPPPMVSPQPRGSGRQPQQAHPTTESNDLLMTTITGLPDAFSTLAQQLHTLCGMLSQLTICEPAAISWWPSLVSDECKAATDLTLAFVRLVLAKDGDNAQPATATSRQRDALVGSGLLPQDWLAKHLSVLGDVGFSNVVSVAQVLVLVVSRLGFVLHLHRCERLPASLHLSLVQDPQQVLHNIQQRYAIAVACDTEDVWFALEPSVTLKETADDAKRKESVNTGTSATSREPETRTRKRSLTRRSVALVHHDAPKELHQAAASSSCPLPPVPAWLIVQDDKHGIISGIHVEGLVAVERVSSLKTDKIQILIHELPPCRLVCRVRTKEIPPTDEVDLGQSSLSPSSGAATATAAQLTLQDGVPLTAIASTSAFQTIPDSFFAPASSTSAFVGGSSTLLERVVCAASLIAAVPSLSRPRSDHETSTFVLAVPLFASDDGDTSE